MSILEKFGYTSSTLTGTAIGNEWLKGEKPITSFNPNDGSEIAKVEQTTAEQLEKVVASAHEAFLKFRDVPAPKRGELVRLMGDELRKYKKELGLLVATEMGKSLAEGEGEVLRFSRVGVRDAIHVAEGRDSPAARRVRLGKSGNVIGRRVGVIARRDVTGETDASVRQGRRTGRRGLVVQVFHHDPLVDATCRDFR